MMCGKTEELCVMKMNNTYKINYELSFKFNSLTGIYIKMLLLQCG